MKDGMRLFGVTIDRNDGNGTEFLAVLAHDENAATKYAVDACEGVVTEITDLESVVDEQYNGVAFLSTGGF